MDIQSIYKEAEDIFSVAVNKTAARDYIKVLFFLKAANVVFDSEVKRILEQENCSKETAEFLCFHNNIAIPQEARWERISAVESSIGFYINKALKLVEEYNPLIKDDLSTQCPLWPVDSVIKQAIEKISNYNNPQTNKVLDIFTGKGYLEDILFI